MPLDYLIIGFIALFITGTLRDIRRAIEKQTDAIDRQTTAIIQMNKVEDNISSISQPTELNGSFW